MHALLLLPFALQPQPQPQPLPPQDPSLPHQHPGESAHTHRTGDDAGGTWVYYDYVDDAGRLSGGRVKLSEPVAIDETFGTAAADGTNVVTLLNNGPVGNRLDVVFLGDGYTAAQMGVYANHVNSVWPAVMAEPPLSNYLSYFNIHRVDVVSNESGVDNDPFFGIQKDTALDMEYWCSGIDRLLCVSQPKAAVQAANAPGVDQILALANSSTYGGAGYPANDLATLAGNNGASVGIAIHEFGHSLGDLADEYDYGGPTTYTGGEPPEPNVSTFTTGELASLEEKWYRWLDVPGVGAFQGAKYSVFGIYRPTFNSVMRNLGNPFDPVNTEVMVAKIYAIVNPIDDASPAGTYLNDAVLFVDPMDPVSHALDVTWLADGVAIPGATGTTLDCSTIGLAEGLHTITARVVDNTPLVRDPELRETFLTEERSWGIAVPSDPQPPLVGDVTGDGWISTAGPFGVSGAFLEGLTGARIGGVPVAILGSDFDSATLLAPAVGALAPGLADVEVDGPGGTALLEDAVLIGPYLQAETTGPGGTLTVSYDMASPLQGTFTLAVSGGKLPFPLPIGTIYHGLELDPAAALTAIDSQTITAEAEVVFPVPDLPTLAGATLHLQAHVFGIFIPLPQSFTNATSVTF